MKTKLQPMALAMFVLLAFVPGLLRAQWNPNTAVNIQISSLPMADMQAAPTTDGKTWVAYYHQNGGNYDMRAQLIDANGYKLLGPDGVLVSNQTSGSATFVFNVCVDEDNNLIIGFQYEAFSDMMAVVYKIAQDGTKLWGDDGIDLGLGLAPYPAALSNGEVVVAWIDGSTNTLSLQKITTGGTTAWATPISITVSSSSTSRGQVIANTAGKFTVVYQKLVTGPYTTLYAQMFDNSGTALYAPLQISDLTTAAYRYYSIAAEGDTTYFGYYASVGNRFNSYLQRINPAGTIPWGMNGSNFNTSTGTNDSYQMQTDINLASGSAYVWSLCTFSDPTQTVYGVYVQKFLKTSGARQFTNTGKVVYPINNLTIQQCGKLGLTSDNPIFMTYDVDEKIYVTRLDESGNFVWPGDNVIVSSTTASPGNPKMRYCLTPDGPNRFACTWTENRLISYLGYAQGISIGGLVGLTVETEGGVAPEITVDHGTLQLVATVFPAEADQEVNWSIVPGSGSASISASGLVTAITNGDVFAVAAAVQDTTVTDTLAIEISGQTTGIRQNDPQAMKIRPVPNDGKFTLTIDSYGETSWELAVYNNSGVKIYSDNIATSGGISSIPVDLGIIPDGLYTVALTCGERQLVQKIVVSR